jgi:hypothetical protein
MNQWLPLLMAKELICVAPEGTLTACQLSEPPDCRTLDDPEPPPQATKPAIKIEGKKVEIAFTEAYLIARSAPDNIRKLKSERTQIARPERLLMI